MLRFLLILMISLLVLSCKQDNSDQTVDYVDLEKFMGDWYVISILPNPIEKNVVNGIENYQLNEKGGVDITYTFFKDSPQGKKKVMHPKADIFNKETNSEWRVQFFWPIKFPYLVIYLDEEYETTVIGVANKKYAWVMSRKPKITAEKYAEVLDRMKELEYDVDKLVEIPQIWE